MTWTQTGVRVMPDTSERPAPITVEDLRSDPVALATEEVRSLFFDVAKGLSEKVPAGPLFDDCLRCLLAARHKAQAAITEAAKQDGDIPEEWVV